MKIFGLILVFVFYSTSSYAYIDPGLIAGLFNLIVASVSAFFVFFVFRPLNFLKELFSKKKVKDKNKVEDQKS